MWTFDLLILAEIVLRTLIVYAAVVVGLRLSGKREIGQMTILDFVLLLLVANTVQNAMTGPDTSLNGGLIAAATLLAANFLVTRLVFKNRRARKLLEGSATMLVYRGKVMSDIWRGKKSRSTNCTKPCANTARRTSRKSRLPFWKLTAQSAF